MTNVPNGPTGEAMPDPHSRLAAVPTKLSPYEAMCPMLSLIRAYKAERERYNASDDPDDEADSAHFHWLHDRLTHDTPPVYTTEGAVAALRHVAESMENEIGGFQEPLLAAVLVFQRTAHV